MVSKVRGQTEHSFTIDDLGMVYAPERDREVLINAAVRLADAVAKANIPLYSYKAGGPLVAGKYWYEDGYEDKLDTHEIAQLWAALVVFNGALELTPISDIISEDTMFLDKNGTPIRTGHVVKAPITINQDTHGTWGLYRVKKAPGGYKLSYLRSEKGQILPEGYAGGYMHELLPDSDERDLKTLVFTQVPIKVEGWEIVK